MFRSTLRTLSLLGAFGMIALPAFGQPRLVVAPGTPHMLLGPSPVPQVIRDGKIKTDCTKLDIGEPMDMFDGKYEKPIRTPSINPAYFEFVVDEPISFYGIRIKTITAKHSFTLAAAANADDLKNKTGSYTVLSKGTTDSSGDIIYAGRTPVSYSAFRVDLKRLEGDDYVHMYEWDFLEPVKVEGIKVDCRIRNAHAGEPAIYMPLDENATRPVNSLLIPRVNAEVNGRSIDVTDSAVIKYSSKYGKPWLGGPNLLLTKPETVGVIVSLGDSTFEGKVKVTPRKSKNTQPDLDAMYVERLPKINFDGPNGGWPKDGQQVTWRAHVKNWGTKPVKACYTWNLDGRVVAKGGVRIKAGQIATVDYPWTWEKRRHYLTFNIDPDNRIAELVEHNNTVDFATDAISVGFYIEQSFADIHHDNQYLLGLDDANSFVDYSQRILRHWNKMLAHARFPETPHGVLDRVRLDEVVTVPDQSLPFQGGNYPTNSPNLDDKTIDLMWGFPYKVDHFKNGLDIDKMKKLIAEGNMRGEYFFMDLALIHELNHARYLVDSYGFDVSAGSKDPEKSNIRIKDDQGRYILGLYLKKDGIVHLNHYQGDMDSTYEQYGPYEAMAWNRIAGQRAQGGNTNGTSHIGTYLQDIPKQFKIKFVGPNGEALANDPVKVYWAEPKNEWYGKLYDNTVDREFATDSDGAITTDATFFAKDGKIKHTWGYSNAVPIVRVDHKGKTYYIFIEVSEVNMLANASKDPVPTLVEPVPLRQGDPTPLAADYNRRTLPDYRIRTAFDPVKKGRVLGF